MPKNMYEVWIRSLNQFFLKNNFVAMEVVITLVKKKKNFKKKQ